MLYEKFTAKSRNDTQDLYEIREQQLLATVKQNEVNHSLNLSIQELNHNILSLTELQQRTYKAQERLSVDVDSLKDRVAYVELDIEGIKSKQG